MTRLRYLIWLKQTVSHRFLVLPFQSDWLFVSLLSSERTFYDPRALSIKRSAVLSNKKFRKAATGFRHASSSHSLVDLSRIRMADKKHRQDTGRYGSGRKGQGRAPLASSSKNLFRLDSFHIASRVQSVVGESKRNGVDAAADLPEEGELCESSTRLQKAKSKPKSEVHRPVYSPQRNDKEKQVNSHFFFQEQSRPKKYESWSKKGNRKRVDNKGRRGQSSKSPSLSSVQDDSPGGNVSSAVGVKGKDPDKTKAKRSRRHKKHSQVMHEGLSVKSGHPSSADSVVDEEKVMIISMRERSVPSGYNLMTSEGGNPVDFAEVEEGEIVEESDEIRGTCDGFVEQKRNHGNRRRRSGKRRRRKRSESQEDAATNDEKQRREKRHEFSRKTKRQRETERRDECRKEENDISVGSVSHLMSQARAPDVVRRFNKVRMEAGRKNADNYEVVCVSSSDEASSDRNVHPKAADSATETQPEIYREDEVTGTDCSNKNLEGKGQSFEYLENWTSHWGADISSIPLPPEAVKNTLEKSIQVASGGRNHQTKETDDSEQAKFSISKSPSEERSLGSNSAAKEAEACGSSCKTSQSDLWKSDLSSDARPLWLEALTSEAQAYATRQQTFSFSIQQQPQHRAINNPSQNVPTDRFQGWTDQDQHNSLPAQSLDQRRTLSNSNSQGAPKAFQSLSPQTQNQSIMNQESLPKRDFAYHQNIPNSSSQLLSPVSGLSSHSLKQNSEVSSLRPMTPGNSSGATGRDFDRRPFSAPQSPHCPPGNQHASPLSTSSSGHRQCQSDAVSWQQKPQGAGEDVAQKKSMQFPSCSEVTHSQRNWHTVRAMDDRVPGSLEFSVMSYNILSQNLLEFHPYLYGQCEKENLKWRNRGPALVQQILAHNADVLCLQEVQEDHWVSLLRGAFHAHGYRSFYKRKPGNKCDGCAVLYKADKFNLLRAVPVNMDRGGILDRENVGVIVLLEPRSDVYSGAVRRLCVATTHLLFNPRRGDVKLAQLVLFLAEIDKQAYLDPDCWPIEKCPDATGVGVPQSGQAKIDRDAEDRVRGPGAGARVTDASGVQFPSQGAKLKASLTGDRTADKCDIFGYEQMRESITGISGTASPRMEEDRDCTASKTAYCPIILCGDFNSEPWSDFYKFVTSGELQYQGLISRLICGQEEGQTLGTNLIIPRVLMPNHLKISEHCQFKHVADSRWYQTCRRKNKAGVPVGKRQPWASNTGRLHHAMNLKSAYRHFADCPGPVVKEVSTFHLRASCTVDYIFFSSGSCSRSHDRFKDSECFQHLQHSDSSRATANRLGYAVPRSVDRDCDNSVQCAMSVPDTSDNDALVLLSRYRLLTSEEVSRTGYMPNAMFPSDHLCLIARFLLR
ncbi:uncharacterized protein LOC101847300 [Aplysia californica]|uniref:Uncharacterized protein LOC101847300 n=1 Tax=Aplysia californica TaxID=6500 RepID=A0ABM0JB76_APLCA|nr:uncharacterized protein LOC101847300 [Aplysia californica]